MCIYLHLGGSTRVSLTINMPAWSIDEWRARIGSSWCAVGRPFKTRSPFRNQTRKWQRASTLNQVVTFVSLMVVLVGLNLRLGILARRSHDYQFLSKCQLCTCYANVYIMLSSCRFFEQWQTPFTHPQSSHLYHDIICVLVIVDWSFVWDLFLILLHLCFTEANQSITVSYPLAYHLRYSECDFNLHSVFHFALFKWSY